MNVALEKFIVNVLVKSVNKSYLEPRPKVVSELDPVGQKY